MVRTIVRFIRTSLRRPFVRSTALLVVSIAAASVWFGLFVIPAEPSGQVAAAPSASPGGPSASASASPSPTASPRPTASPEPAVVSAPPPSAGAAPIPSLGPGRPSVELPQTAPPRGTDATRRALSLRLDTLRATYGLPGVSAAILFADGSIWTGTSGLADVAAERPVTPDTEFAVASISKTFLAALILELAEEGTLELEAPVRDYLPDLAIDPAITVHQLLDHTSGLHDFFYDPDIDKALLADRERVWTAEDSLAYVGKPYFKPGKGWHYSNTNYVILGLLAEAVGGAPLATQLHARFLAPLGLDHTHYQAVDEPLGPLARAYRFDGPGLDEPAVPLTDGTEVVPFTSVVTAAGSAGSIASTAEDLVTWARALYGGRILQPATLAAMVADARATAPFKPSIPYGLGVQVATIDGRPTLGHSGRLLGSRTVVRWLPDEGIAIAVLTNQSRNDPNLVARALLRVVLGTPVECTSCSAPN
jgi:D-alanyl-D-alanine carboxypeptidase